MTRDDRFQLAAMRLAPQDSVRTRVERIRFPHYAPGEYAVRYRVFVERGPTRADFEGGSIAEALGKLAAWMNRRAPKRAA